jgi:RNA polymerase sigma-70 factor (ECF subfamily)
MPVTLDPHETFETYRPLMFSIAYRMLGSAMEAEDILQEAYLRYQGVPPETIRSPRAFLSTVVTRLCLNQLDSAREKREAYIGPWLPEPVLTDTETEQALTSQPTSPAQQAELHDSLSLAFLALLEQLSPAERAVFLLREVFDYDYDEIAGILEKDEAACRQLLSRAKKHISENRPRLKANPERHRQLLTQFIEAANTGELDGLMSLLAEDVTMWTDGGGKTRGAALQPLHGRRAVAQFIVNANRFVDAGAQIGIETVNGQPAIVFRVEGRPFVVVAVEISDDEVYEIRAVGNPDKLKGL